MSTSSIITENTATCIRGSFNGIECVCDSGFTHDFSLLRYKNCALPVGYYEANFICGAVVGVFTLFYGARSIQRAKGQVKSLLYLFEATSFFATLSSAVALGRGFTGREFWVIAGIFVILMGIGYSRFVYLFLVVNNTIVAGHNRKIRNRASVRFFLGVNAFLVGLNLGVIVPIFSLSLGNERDPAYDVAMYNFGFKVIVALFPLHLVAIVPIAWVVTNQILEQLGDGGVKQKQQHALISDKLVVTSSANDSSGNNLTSDNNNNKGVPSFAPSSVRGEQLVRNLASVRKRIVTFRIFNTLVFPIGELGFLTLLLSILLIWPEYSYIFAYLGPMILMSYNFVPLVEIYILTQTNLVKMKRPPGDAMESPKNNDSALKKDSKKDSKDSGRNDSDQQVSPKVMLEIKVAGEE